MAETTKEKPSAKKVEKVKPPLVNGNPKLREGAKVTTANVAAYLEAAKQEMGKRSCKYFIENFVKIEDVDAIEVGGEKASLFKLWPKQVDALTSLLANRLNIVLKSRQLGLTWLALAIAVWFMIHLPGYVVVALSKTETPDAKELIRRMVFILSNLPQSMITENTKEFAHIKGLKWESTVLSITILHKKYPSVFTSMSAGPDSGRSFTANLVILDEWAYQQWAREIYSSAYPTINRPTGGKVIGLSSAKRMTMFQEIWIKATTGLNTFNRIFLPWSTDPRRDEEWYARTKRDMGDHLTKQEYPSTAEEAFESADGVAFPEFSYDIHVVEPFKIPDHWRRWRSADNGYTDPFAWYWFAVDEFGTVYVYREYTRDPKDPKVSYSDQAKQVVLKSGAERHGFTVVGHDAWAVHPLTRSNNTPQGKSIIDFYNEGGITDCLRAVTDRMFRKATYHEYLKPYYDENAEKLTSKVKFFSNCTKIIETLPQLLIDEKDPEKVQECAIDHWFDGCGYGLIAYHSNKTEIETTVSYANLPDDILEDLDHCKSAEERDYILAKIGR